MRYKPEHKEQTHQKIVETASKEFRAHGFEGVGIAKLMGVLELTHGGFYAHFADKEALVAEASVFALDQRLEMMLDLVKTDGIEAVITYYLSEGHRDQPEIGCLLPALSAEVARHSPVVRETFTKKLWGIFEAFAEFMPGETDTERIEQVGVIFASMVGAITLSRAVSDPVMSETILRSTQEHLFQFVKKSGV